jgi:hypothetical protein
MQSSNSSYFYECVRMRKIIVRERERERNKSDKERVSEAIRREKCEHEKEKCATVKTD